MEMFRPLYDNLRDDHLVLRHLTQCSAIIEKCDHCIRVNLLPSMQFARKPYRIIDEFLKQVSIEINSEFGEKYLPIQIRLLEHDSETFKRMKEKGLEVLGLQYH